MISISISALCVAIGFFILGKREGRLLKENTDLHWRLAEAQEQIDAHEYEMRKLANYYATQDFKGRVPRGKK